MRCRAWLVALSVALLAAAGGCGRSLLVPRQTHVPEAGATVPMRPDQALPLVEVRLNGQGPFVFLLDTGSNLSMVAPGVVEMLQLRRVRSIDARMRDAGGAHQKTDVVAIDRIDLGDASFHEVHAAVLSGLPADGILGFQVFTDCLLVMDFPARTVSVRPGSLAGRRDAEILPMIGRVGIASIAADIGAMTGTAMLLDTGCAHRVHLRRTDSPSLSFVGEPQPGDVARFLHSSEREDVGQLDADIVFGPHVLVKPVVRLGQGQRLGVRALDRFRLTFDEANRLVRIETAGGGRGDP